MAILNSEEISSLLVQTGAYLDLKEPTLLASGELGIYYINTEKLVQDDGEWERFCKPEVDPVGMIQHAIKMSSKQPTFGDVIDTLASKVQLLMGPQRKLLLHSVSGGERRDWLFSGPVANRLRLPHITIYKDGRVELMHPDFKVEQDPDLTDFYDVHLSDLLTKGSSAYNPTHVPPTGWIPYMGAHGLNVRNNIRDYVTVVTRLQGGEELLSSIGIKTHSYVAIDKNFLREHSQNKAVALAYAENSGLWSQNYLREHGALPFVDFFDPKGGKKKLEKAGNFVNKYGDLLRDSGKMEELEGAVQSKYGKTLNEILGGE